MTVRPADMTWAEHEAACLGQRKRMLPQDRGLYCPTCNQFVEPPKEAMPDSFLLVRMGNDRLPVPNNHARLDESIGRISFVYGPVLYTSVDWTKDDAGIYRLHEWTATHLEPSAKALWLADLAASREPID